MAKVKGYDLDTSAHAVFSLYYHIIFVTKYRRKAMHSETIRERLKQIMYDLAPGLKIQIVSQEPADDHIHQLHAVARPLAARIGQVVMWRHDDGDAMPALDERARQCGQGSKVHLAF